MNRVRQLDAVAAIVLLFIAAWACQFSRSEETGAEAKAATQPLVVFAAMSLKEPVTEIVEAYEAQTGAEVTVQFAGSNRLAHQIEASHKQDVFLSASPAWTDYLVEAGLAPEQEVATLASNRLVVVVHRRSPLSPTSLAGLRATGVRHLSLAEPRGVPAGRYAKAALSESKVWSDVEGKVVPGSNVRSALQLVTADLNVAGFVYRTDAAQEPRVRTLFEVPLQLTGPITYTVTPLRRGSAEPTAAARHFAAYCLGDAAQRALSRYGFEAP